MTPTQQDPKPVLDAIERLLAAQTHKPTEAERPELEATLRALQDYRDAGGTDLDHLNERVSMIYGLLDWGPNAPEPHGGRYAEAATPHSGRFHTGGACAT